VQIFASFFQISWRRLLNFVHIKEKKL